MNENLIINGSYDSSGIYRAIMYYDGSILKVFVPGLSASTQVPSKDVWMTALFESYELRDTSLKNQEVPCWVIFENGNMGRPIVMGYFGKGVRSIGASIVPNNASNEETVENNPSPSPEVTGGTPSTSKNKTEINNKLKEILQPISSHNIAYYIKDLSDNEIIEYNSSMSLPAASIMKLFIAAKIYNLKLNKSLNNELQLMLGVSDNAAANKLIDYCDGSFDEAKKDGTQSFAAINSYAKSLGCNNTNIGTYYGYAPYDKLTVANSNGWYTNIFTSAKDCGILLESLYKQSFISPEISNDFLNKLKNASAGDNKKFRSANVSGVTFYDKSGETGKIQNHVAYVKTSNKKFIICLMTSQKKGGSGYSESTAISLFSSFFKETYNYINGKN